MVVVGVVFFVWGWRSGQFRDVEASQAHDARRPRSGAVAGQAPAGTARLTGEEGT